MTKFETITARLYANEINFEVRTYWDLGISVSVLDEIRAPIEPHWFSAWDWDSMAEWLDESARKYFPEREYAKNE